MSNRRQPWHLERSVVTINWLRAAGVTQRQLEDAISAGDASTRAPYARAHRIWSARQPIGFDPVGQLPSDLERIDRLFDGAADLFFHPLWTLMAPPLRSTEKYRLRLAKTPGWLLEDERRVAASTDEAASAKARKRLDAYARRDSTLERTSRAREAALRSRTTGVLDLRVVHQCVVQLRSPLRDAVMEPSCVDTDDTDSNDVPWVRRSHDPRRELEAALAAPLIDRLALGLALVMEAGLCGRERDHLRLREAMRPSIASVRRSRLFEGVGKKVVIGFTQAANRAGMLETGTIYAQLAALPASWSRRLLARMSEIDVQRLSK